MNKMKRNHILLLSCIASLLVHCSLGLTKASLAERYRSQPLNIDSLKQEDKYKSQDRTYKHYEGTRVLAPKQKTYPFLDQLEYLLFPSFDFKKENPGKRLERLEVSVFGNKQKGKIVNRLHKLEEEINGWQIANMRAMSSIASKTKTEDKNSHAFINPEPEGRSLVSKRTSLRRNRRAPVTPYSSYSGAYQNLYPNAYPNQYPSRYSNRFQQNSFDRSTERVAVPLMRQLGSRSIREIFK